MEFKQVFKLIQKLEEKKESDYLIEDEKELLIELKFLIKTQGHQKIKFSESLGLSDKACPTCGREY